MRLLTLIITVLATSYAMAQGADVTEAERARASMMILLLVIGGIFLTYLLLWYLRVSGKLPEEKPRRRPLWVHPDDEDAS
jgi:cytochrome bd-type quinol oxidase subunit 2